MKYIVIILLLVIICACNSKIKREYYSNGIEKEEYSFINNRFEGVYKTWYSNGNPQSVGKYSDGKMDGEWKLFYSNGRIQSIQKYKVGKLTNINSWSIEGVQEIINGTGVANLFDTNGKLLSRMSYKNNVLDGKCETWYNGIKATEIYYKDGKRTGEWSYWNEIGKLIKTERY